MKGCNGSIEFFFTFFFNDYFNPRLLVVIAVLLFNLILSDTSGNVSPGDGQVAVF